MSILTFDPWHHQVIFLYTNAARWIFSLFGSILCKPKSWADQLVGANNHPTSVSLKSPFLNSDVNLCVCMCIKLLPCDCVIRELCSRAVEHFTWWNGWWVDTAKVTVCGHCHIVACNIGILSELDSRSPLTQATIFLSKPIKETRICVG